MESVFIVQHLHKHSDGLECVKLIGAYRCLAAALLAVERRRVQPGFCDSPRVINPLLDADESGFSIEEYQLDKDHWTEGFVTV